MVYRVYVEKRPELANEAAALQNQIVSLLQIPHLEKLRLLNRYDVESIDKALFDACVRTVFSEPQLDLVYNALPTEGATCFAVEYLPGQYDQRADSAAQCIQILTQGVLWSARRGYTCSMAISPQRKWRASSAMSSTQLRAGRPLWNPVIRWSWTMKSQAQWKFSTVSAIWM